MPQPHAPLTPFSPDAIPQALRSAARWAPWKAVWSEKRQKFDKIPCQPNGYGLSTAKPERWLTFDAALAALAARPEQFAGLGYVMTGAHGVVGVDLDRCITNGVVAPWAQEVVDALGSYAEVSPSGNGLRIYALGDAPEDWTNHDRGIEVYAGHEPRFLTVTGSVLAGHAELVAAPAGVVASLSSQYAKAKSSATVISLTLPDLVDELALPDVASLDMPYTSKDFLLDGTHRGDRSRELFAASVALYQAGLADDAVLSVLAASPHAWEVALDHRRQDPDRALMYLWVEHAQKAKARGTSKVASVDDFDIVGAGPSTLPEAKPVRFAFTQAEAFTEAQAVEWLIKGLLPKAELGAIFGPSGAGKSFFALELVMSCVTGTPWRGKPVAQGAVAYICAEGAGGFRLRIKAHSEHYGVPLTGLPLHILGDAPNLLERKDVADLIAALRLLPPLKLIVVDTLAQVTPGANENSGEDMGRALGHCKALHKATGAMVVLVAHAGKDESRGLRGWSGIKGALDVEIQVQRSGHHRAATVSKLKDGEGEGEEYGFQLETVVLGQDADGDDITSCVLKANASGPRAAAKAEPKGVWQQTVLRVAQSLLDLPGALMPAQLIDAAVAEMPAPEHGKRDKRRELAMRAIEALVGVGRISLAGGEVAVL
jgi:hypothetical protein